MVQTKRIEIDERFKHKLLALREELGSTTKVIEYLATKGIRLTKTVFQNILRGKRRFFKDIEYQAITGHDAETQVAFVRRMIKWYAYFTEGRPKGKLIKIAEILGLKRENIYQFLLGKLYSLRAPIESYFLNWYFQEGFESKEDVSAFLDEMERVSQEFPIFDRVDKQTLGELAQEISRPTGMSLISLLPREYFRKTYPQQKTFPFSDYQKPLRMREEIKQHYAELLYNMIANGHVSFRDYIVRTGRSLSDLKEWEEKLLELQYWEIKRFPEMKLVELRRKPAPYLQR